MVVILPVRSALRAAPEAVRSHSEPSRDQSRPSERTDARTRTPPSVFTQPPEKPENSDELARGHANTAGPSHIARTTRLGRCMGERYTISAGVAPATRGPRATAHPATTRRQPSGARSPESTPSRGTQRASLRSENDEEAEREEGEGDHGHHVAHGICLRRPSTSLRVGAKPAGPAPLRLPPGRSASDPMRGGRP